MPFTSLFTFLLIKSVYFHFILPSTPNLSSWTSPVFTAFPASCFPQQPGIYHRPKSGRLPLHSKTAKDLSSAIFRPQEPVPLGRTLCYRASALAKLGWPCPMEFALKGSIFLAWRSPSPSSAGKILSVASHLKASFVVR